jgi:hypothetical protein
MLLGGTAERLKILQSPIYTPNCDCAVSFGKISWSQTKKAPFLLMDQHSTVDYRGNLESNF